VVPYITVNGETEILPSLFTFSLVNSIRDFWQAKVYPLSLLVAVLSGAWPYGKVLLMLMAWIVPPAWLPPARRETILLLVDALGKWSLIDSFIMVTFQIAFHFHFHFDVPEDPPFSGPGLLPSNGTSNASAPVDIKLFVVSYWGFTGFLIATMLSLFLSHTVLGVHRYVPPPPPIFFSLFFFFLSSFLPSPTNARLSRLASCPLASCPSYPLVLSCILAYLATLVAPPSSFVSPSRWVWYPWRRTLPELGRPQPTFCLGPAPMLL
jgi:hypothetical protein